MAKTAGPFLENSYPISQHFGGNYARYAQFGLLGHNGIDIAVPMETTVVAGVKGVVTEVGNDAAGWGQYVKVVDASQNLEILYAHLNSIAPLIQRGMPVNPQNPIGGTGNTGNSTGPHLHLGFGDTDSAGMRINRENGYYGFLNPEDTNWLTLRLFGSGAAVQPSLPSPTATPGSTTPSYVGPPPPPYLPTFAGQAVSVNGNFFQSDDGKMWIFKGTDAERAAAAIPEASVSKFNLLTPPDNVQFPVNQIPTFEWVKAVDSQGRAVTFNFKLTGHESPEKVAAAGTQREFIKTGITKNFFTPPDSWFRENFGYDWSVEALSSTGGTYPANGQRNISVLPFQALPPTLPVVTPVIPAPTPITPVIPAPSAGTPPASTSPGTEPWAGKKAPTHKDIFNKIVVLFEKLIGLHV